MQVWYWEMYSSCPGKATPPTEFAEVHLPLWLGDGFFSFIHCAFNMVCSSQHRNHRTHRKKRTSHICMGSCSHRSPKNPESSRIQVSSHIQTSSQCQLVLSCPRCSPEGRSWGWGLGRWWPQVGGRRWHGSPRRRWCRAGCRHWCRAVGTSPRRAARGGRSCRAAYKKPS